MSKNIINLRKLLLSNPLMATVRFARYKFVSKMLSMDDAILDVGCGEGFSAFYYSKFCKSVTGIDIDKIKAKSWNEYKKPKINFFLFDANQINKLKSKANCIVNIDFIEHIEKKEGIQFIKNCKKFLESQKDKKSKMLIIGTPSYYSRKYRAKHNLQIHKYEYKPDELNEICKKFFTRTFMFTMNDELVHTGFNKLGWYFFIICIL